jgi:uncharacterized protein (TIGR00730 family)
MTESVPTVAARPAVCVFCGANTGFSPVYAAAARDFSAELLRRDLGLVYGGGSIGMMGIVADAVLAGGGSITGVIPTFLATRELLHPGITDMRLVPTMHARKALMADLCTAFVALPGGLGTFEELFEVLTWTQLGLYAKPIGLLNVAGYFDPLVEMIRRAAETGFCRTEHLSLFSVSTDPAELLSLMETWRPTTIKKWLAEDEI